MEIILDDQHYKVVFRYYDTLHVYLPRSFKFVTRRATVCSLLADHIPGTLQDGTVSIGKALLNPHDARGYNRNIGRKIAFGKALQYFTKDDRLSLWKQFFEQSRASMLPVVGVSTYVAFEP